MNSQVHKRSNRVSSLTVENGNGVGIGLAGLNPNSPTSREMQQRRRRRLRRKQEKEKARNTTFAVVMTFLFGSILLIASFYLGYYVNETRSPEEDDNHQRPPRHRGPPNLMNPSLDNSPFGNSHKKGAFNKLKGTLKRMTQYKHSDYMEDIGDKSPGYAELRRQYDALLPFGDEASLERMRNAVAALRKRSYQNIMASEVSYDIHDCPDFPPPNYPYAWNVKDVLDNWAPDDPTPREHIYQGLCVFNYLTEKHKALNYREAEVPFVVRDDPKVMRTVERWSQDNFGYIEKMVGKQTKYRTEYSPNNHFMYWNKPRKMKKPKNWEPPTEMMRMPYPEWLTHANVTDDSKLGPDMEHWYFRLIGCGEMGECDKDSSEYLFDELGFFQPKEENELYMVEPHKQKGIHCRFGMKGVIAENHFDGSRNMIALLGGERRYILAHPDQCENLNLLPRGHPSARHSAVDWSDPDWKKFPSFKDAEVNEVVMQAGDVLYLPTNWFHYIISLELNFQCNTRSGVNNEYMDAIRNCGF